jgi:hypothetical protein
MRSKGARQFLLQIKESIHDTTPTLTSTSQRPRPSRESLLEARSHNRLPWLPPDNVSPSSVNIDESTLKLFPYPDIDIDDGPSTYDIGVVDSFDTSNIHQNTNSSTSDIFRSAIVHDHDDTTSLAPSEACSSEHESNRSIASNVSDFEFWEGSDIDESEQLKGIN